MDRVFWWLVHLLLYSGSSTIQSRLPLLCRHLHHLSKYPNRSPTKNNNDTHNLKDFSFRKIAEHYQVGQIKQVNKSASKKTTTLLQLCVIIESSLFPCDFNRALAIALRLSKGVSEKLANSKKANRGLTHFRLTSLGPCKSILTTVQLHLIVFFQTAIQRLKHHSWHSVFNAWIVMIFISKELLYNINKTMRTTLIHKPQHWSCLLSFKSFWLTTIHQMIIIIHTTKMVQWSNSKISFSEVRIIRRLLSTWKAYQ